MLLITAISVMTPPVQADPPKESPVTGGTILAALRQGTNWLIDQQSSDGGWHSRTYGKMKPGAGNTALVLEAVSHLPDELRKECLQPFRRGVSFLTRNRSAQGIIQLADESADYPVYATALLVSALKRFPGEASPELETQLCQALLKEQRTIATGWPGDRNDLGGWSPWQTSPVDADGEFPANLSTTVWVLQALDVGNHLPHAAREDASRFLERCWSDGVADQRGGGFIFTPRPDSLLNKLGWVTGPGGSPQPRPYHSTTCDGICGLLILKQATEVDRLEAALKGLSGLTVPSLVSPTIDESAPISPLSALYFYDASAFSDVWSRTHDPRLADQRLEGVRALLESQQTDGSWKNPLVWFHEDDPLIATALALRALCLLAR